jgi:hypothetical protein
LEPKPWQRSPDEPPLAPRSVIHVDDVPWIERTDSTGKPVTAIKLRPVTGAECDLTALTFSFPPNYVGKVHWHPVDTLYIIRAGQFIVQGEGTYEAGDIRWVKAGTPYGPESAGPDGCEVYLIAAGVFPLPTFDPAVDPPPAGDTQTSKP